MFLDRLFNQGSAPLLEGMVRFTSARHEVLAENIVNVSTPGYVQKDLSVPKFQRDLAERIQRRAKSGPGQVGFGDLRGEADRPSSGLLFHDRNNRSMERLMSDLSSNALKHNMYSEMLRKQFDSMETVLRDRLA